MKRFVAAIVLVVPILLAVADAVAAGGNWCPRC